MMTVMVILVAYARSPELLSEPRFWAEEGTNYFSFAYNHNWLANLFSPQFGYNTLYNSIATSLAAMVSLDYAPAVTTYLALFVQLSVSAAVIWWDIPLLDSLPKKLAVAILIQTLAYSRIWVTTIGVQYWLCILSVLILLYNHNAVNRRMFGLQNCLLALNGLTGILSCLLIPAFALKYVKTRSRPVLVQTAILGLCLLVQGAVFTWFYVNDHADMKIRFGDSSLLYVLCKIIRFQITVPLFERYAFSSPLGEYAEIKIRNALFTITGPAINSPAFNFYFLEMFVGVATVCYLCVLAYRKIRQLDTQLLVISILLVTVVSTYFSVNGSGGPRYTFAPGIMIMLLVVGAVTDRTIPKAMRYVATLLVALSLITSLMYYRSNMMGGVAYDPSWPKWRDELSVWRTDHAYPLGIWPPPWKMTLSGK